MAHGSAQSSGEPRGRVKWMTGTPSCPLALPAVSPFSRVFFERGRRLVDEGEEARGKKLGLQLYTALQVCATAPGGKV
ncbi:hypothetical protein NDU88_006088 [Pleurodeles waltl]|uniref:Uncharacterized protein n=1 Tax=Pleurodeles waltl TaxID=8319 RepID=A0AAV7UJX9_PLEWA|nr:hypothetical protein NDU88_006088 [Pleurodeles waltl]